MSVAEEYQKSVRRFWIALGIAIPLNVLVYFLFGQYVVGCLAGVSFLVLLAFFFSVSCPACGRVMGKEFILGVEYCPQCGRAFVDDGR